MHRLHPPRFLFLVKLVLVALVMALIASLKAAPASASIALASSNVGAAANAAPTTPGVALAQDVTELTGVAISPLLGVSAVGAWQYFHASEAERARLPWYCQPWFIGTAALILLLCLSKDIIGTALPGWMLKPLHFIELIENKLSAGLAGGTLVPIIAMHMNEALSGNPSVALPQGHLPFAIMPHLALGKWGLAITLPITALVFVMVWVCSHALHVLICMCPIGLVATALKLAKNAILALLVGLSAIDPRAGFVFALLIIAVSTYFAGTAMRLTVYGALMTIDTVMSWLFLRSFSDKRYPAFLNATLLGLPTRTFGHISADSQGKVVFESRAFYLGKTRRIVLPSAGLTVSKCLFHPVLLGAKEGQAVLREIIHFLPRCASHEDAIARHLDLPATGDPSPAKPLTIQEQWVGA